MTDLGTLGGRWSDAAAIDDQGQIVGSSATRSGDSHAFLWQAGNMTDLGTLGGQDSEAVAVNEHGQVIGVSATAGSPRQMTRAFLWQNGKMIDLGVSVDPYRISLEMNGGEVVGATGPGNEPTGFVWSGGKAISLGTSIPTGVDSRGDVVGGTAARSFREHAFIWRDGSFTLLPGPALASTPRAWIDSDGKRIVAVSDETAGLRRRILLWTRAS
jgi:probable HAF family extracellular repeat protein